MTLNATKQYTSAETIWLKKKLIFQTHIWRSCLFDLDSLSVVLQLTCCTWDQWLRTNKWCDFVHSIIHWRQISCVSFFSICGAAQLMQCCLKADHRLIHIKETFIRLLFLYFYYFTLFHFLGCFHTFLHIYLDTESMFSHGWPSLDSRRRTNKTKCLV